MGNTDMNRDCRTTIEMDFHLSKILLCHTRKLSYIILPMYFQTIFPYVRVTCVWVANRSNVVIQTPAVVVSRRCYSSKNVCDPFGFFWFWFLSGGKKYGIVRNLVEKILHQKVKKNFFFTFYYTRKFTFIINRNLFQFVLLN